MSTVPDRCDIDEDLAPPRRIPPGRRSYAQRALAEINRARQAAGDDWPTYDPGATPSLRGQDRPGRARMAAARVAASVPLDELDRQALDSAEKTSRSDSSSRLTGSAA